MASFIGVQGYSSGVGVERDLTAVEDAKQNKA